MLFSTIKINKETVIVGNKENDIKSIGNNQMNLEQLYDTLKTSQEKKGLILTKIRIWYLSCWKACSSTNKGTAIWPAPAAWPPPETGEHDKDIICPCEYRKPDMEEFWDLLQDFIIGKGEESWDGTWVCPWKKTCRKIKNPVRNKDFVCVGQGSLT